MRRISGLRRHKHQPPEPDRTYYWPGAVWGTANGRITIVFNALGEDIEYVHDDGLYVTTTKKILLETASPIMPGYDCYLRLPEKLWPTSALKGISRYALKRSKAAQPASVLIKKEPHHRITAALQQFDLKLAKVLVKLPKRAPLPKYPYARAGRFIAKELAK
ncbi:hypothetical protein [Methylobacter sp.]|uniref:hypothetical protein n=1 Tax=Methylobacter sp. TaxID=2051955 RepID=UPI0011FD7360|nr:hypothetical protein [Methylobacter sp.]TAK59535.1 MAG: hypothetical protein EPO18_20450 [Methylobacter sp.]